MSKWLRHKSKNGFTIVETIIILAIIGIFCATAIPNLNRARTYTQRDQCIINLRRIAVAKERWSLETGAKDAVTPTSSQLNAYIDDGVLKLKCPLDPNSSFATSYGVRSVSSDPVCKIDKITHTLGKVVATGSTTTTTKGPGGCL